MQDEDIDKLANLLLDRIDERVNGWENTPEFKDLMKNKSTKTIRIYNSIKEMLITHCDDTLMTPTQYASKAIAKQIFKDSKRKHYKD